MWFSEGSAGFSLQFPSLGYQSFSSNTYSLQKLAGRKPTESVQLFPITKVLALSLFCEP